MRLRPLEKIIESANQFAVRILGTVGWYPGVIGFGGYGSETEARILGRVLMTRTGDQRNWLGEKRGWRQYFDAQVPLQPVLVDLGSVQVRTRADRGGYIDLTVAGHGLAAGWHTAHVRAIDSRNRVGKSVSIPIRIIGAQERVGIISDVDDTIMVTMVPQIFQALRTILLARASERQTVVGMPRFFRFLQAHAIPKGCPPTRGPASPGSDFVSRALPPPTFYLSNGAWNVAPTLRRFIERAGYPQGTILLKPWGPSTKGLWFSGPQHKRDEFAQLTAMVPQVKWILIGDNGQRDPTTYTTIANQHPDRVAAIFIRTLSGQEQVFAHGTPHPLDEAARPASQTIPVYCGETGEALRREFVAAKGS